MGLRLCRLEVYYPRSADLFEIAVYDEDEWELIKKNNGKTLYFGEIAGKHSEVEIDLDVSKIEVISEDPGEIAVFLKLFPAGHIGQFSVLDAIEEIEDDDCEDDEDDEDEDNDEEGEDDWVPLR